MIVKLASTLPTPARYRLFLRRLAAAHWFATEPR